MPDVTAQFSFDSMTPAELMARRNTLRDQIMASPGGPETCDIELLKELSALTGTLRRRSSGPPKAAKPAKQAGKKADPKAVLDLL